MRARRRPRRQVDDDHDEADAWDEDELLLEETVGPSQARQMLGAAGADLIGVSWDKVERLTRAMGSGNWSPNRNTLLLSPGRDRLIRGREVLLAVIESGIAVDLLIAELDPEDDLDLPWQESGTPAALVRRGARQDDLPLLVASLRLLADHQATGTGERDGAGTPGLLALFDAEPGLLESVRWAAEEVSACSLLAHETLAVGRHLMRSSASEERVTTFLHALLFEWVTVDTPHPIRRLRLALRREHESSSSSPAASRRLRELGHLLRGWSESIGRLPEQSRATPSRGEAS